MVEITPQVRYHPDELVLPGNVLDVRSLVCGEVVRLINLPRMLLGGAAAQSPQLSLTGCSCLVAAPLSAAMVEKTAESFYDGSTIRSSLL